MSDEPLRPDPDRLLQHTAAPHRGKLKAKDIFRRLRWGR